MNGLSPEEQAFLDEAYTRLHTTRSTFTEKEALHHAFDAGYDLGLNIDSRFTLAEYKRGLVRPHWRLTEHTVVNGELLNELNEGTWDGQNLDQKLAELDQADPNHPRHCIFYQHDPRFHLNKQGIWETTSERQITLPLGIKVELDYFLPNLIDHCRQCAKPLTVHAMLEVFQNFGWDAPSNAARYIKTWLLSSEQFQRVGHDFWILVELLPPEIQRTRLQSLPIRTTQFHADIPDVGLDQPTPKTTKKAFKEELIFKGTATRIEATWTVALRSIHLNEGFIAIPKAMRGIYPLAYPGEEGITVLHTMWFADGERIWLWLDRRHHRLYGPDLFNKLWPLEPGTILRIKWDEQGLSLNPAGIDNAIQQEEARLIDQEELKKLRLSIGESYRQSIQNILLKHPKGLDFKDLVTAVRARQQHDIPLSTIRSLLNSCGFHQHKNRYYASTDNEASTQALRATLLETRLPTPQSEPIDVTSIPYVRTRANTLAQRLRTLRHSLTQPEKNTERL